MLRQFLILASLLSLSSCTLIYKQPIAQGNIISPINANKIHSGMGVSAVVSTLGYPVMTNIYPENRLVYVYSLQKPYQPLMKQHLIISFRNKRVVRVEKS